MGHKWLASAIDSHRDWLSRNLDEDFGVDLEAELDERGVVGEILKIQVKSVEAAKHKSGFVRLTIDRKYLRYAHSCRYPVILVQVDVNAKEAWFLWLQDWMLRNRPDASVPIRSKKTWTHWVPEAQTIESGLSGELKNIAAWRGETQLTLSLMDALRASAGTYNGSMVKDVIHLIDKHAPEIADASLDILIEEAVLLGDRMRGTREGNVIADALFFLARKYGDKVSRATVCNLVLRGESYSRTGLIAMSLLYDEHLEHMRTLALPDFLQADWPDVAFYCAFRESPSGVGFFAKPSASFTFAGLAFRESDRFFDNFANRGASAILDHLTRAP